MFSFFVVIYCSADDKFSKMAVTTTPVLSPSSVTRGHTPHDISTHGDPTFPITTPVSINNASTSITDSSATLIRTRATSTLTSTVSEGHMISRITPLNVTPTSLISENVSSTTNTDTDKSFDKGIGDELDYLFILIVMPLLFIMSVLVLRLKRGKNVNIVDKSLEMKNMDEIEE